MKTRDSISEIALMITLSINDFRIITLKLLHFSAKPVRKDSQDREMDSILVKALKGTIEPMRTSKTI